MDSTMITRRTADLEARKEIKKVKPKRREEKKKGGGGRMYPVSICYVAMMLLTYERQTFVVDELPACPAPPIKHSYCNCSPSPRQDPRSNVTSYCVFVHGGGGTRWRDIASYIHVPAPW